VSWLLIILPLVALVVGVASGFVLGTRQTARMIARMSESQLDDLADRVRRHRDGTG
jgi:uncharacterized protein YneF (UPF0154 family)